MFAAPEASGRRGAGTADAPPPWLWPCAGRALRSRRVERPRVPCGCEGGACRSTQGLKEGDDRCGLGDLSQDPPPPTARPGELVLDKTAAQERGPVEARRWSIYWINSRTGKMFSPVLGGFEGDRGEFYGEDEDDGRPVKVRFVWTKQGPDHAHWEQAFSFDGRTWEVNWTADFVRADRSTTCDGVRPRT